MEVKINFTIIRLAPTLISNFFFCLQEICGDIDKEVVYRAVNFYTEENRYIYFSDVPHLMKTTRNCLANSGGGRGTRYMWNNGNFILMNHIATLYYENCQFDLKWLQN